MREPKLLVVLFALMIAMPVWAQDEQPTPTQPPPQTLTVWLPSTLLTEDFIAPYQALLDHTTIFEDANNIHIIYRTKAVGTVGGLMSTMRSASVVAPGALPDVTLIRRADLVTAQTLGLAQSLETLFSSAIINDLDYALLLGQVETPDAINALYGLPYFLEVQQAVYRAPTDEEETIDLTSITFEDILTQGDSFLLPASRQNGLNQTFYTQYLSAGGIPPRNGSMTLNANALLDVLEFYEAAVEAEIVSPSVLEFQSPSAYRTEFINDMVGFNIGVYSSNEFLSMVQQDADLRPAFLPTASGEPLTTMSGWVWIMVTTEPQKQDLVIRYLNWMMEPDFHAEISNLLSRIPSQQSAIEESLPDGVDMMFFEELLANTVPPLPESEGGTLPRAMQDAMVSVINGDATAEEATQRVIDLFGNN